MCKPPHLNLYIWMVVVSYVAKKLRKEKWQKLTGLYSSVWVSLSAFYFIFYIWAITSCCTFYSWAIYCFYYCIDVYLNTHIQTHIIYSVSYRYCCSSHIHSLLNQTKQKQKFLPISCTDKHSNQVPIRFYKYITYSL